MQPQRRFDHPKSGLEVSKEAFKLKQQSIIALRLLSVYLHSNYANRNKLQCMDPIKEVGANQTGSRKLG